MSDEEYVRSVWENVSIIGSGALKGYVWITRGMCGRGFSTWEAVRIFTETVLEEARQLREEMNLLRGMIALLAFEPGDETAPVYKRTITRLATIYSQHVRGIKPEALEKA